MQQFVVNRAVIYMSYAHYFSSSMVGIIMCDNNAMLTAYIDESHSPVDRKIGGDIYYIGALIVDEQQKKFIEQELAKLKESVIKKFNVPKNVEFHGHCMFQFKGDWECMNGLYTQSTGIYRSAMRILAKSCAKVIIRGVAATELKQRYKERAHTPHDVALQYCLERVNFIAELYKTDITIVADKVADPEAHEGRIKQYQKNGNTEGFYDSNLSHIVMPFHWEDSRQYFGLQMIDMALFIASRAAMIDKSLESSQLSRGDKAVLKTAHIIDDIICNSGVYFPMKHLIQNNIF